MTSQRYVEELTCRIDEVTKHVSSSPARKRACRQVSSADSSTALAPRSLPSFPGLSIPIVRHSEGSLKAKNRRRHRTRKGRTGKSQCTYAFCRTTSLMTAD